MERWLKCAIYKGMFSNERTITVKVKGNGSVEFIVPEKFVTQINNVGQVKVMVFDGPSAKLAVLPTVYKETIPVDETELLPA